MNFKSVRTALSCPCVAFPLVLLISGIAIGGVMVAEMVFGLKPCELCLYQRWPYFINGVLALAGLFCSFSFDHLRAAAVVLFACALVFLAGGALGFYHNGVEQHWWTSILEGCAVPDFAAAGADLKNLIESTQAARCDEIPWADPVLGLSMAAWNALLSPLFAVFSAYCGLLVLRRANGMLD